MAKNTGLTTYSEKINGNPGNHGWLVGFDVTDGYLGITQFDGNTVGDRVLLSPTQVKELVRFVAAECRKVLDERERGCCSYCKDPDKCVSGCLKRTMQLLTDDREMPHETQASRQ